MLDSKPPHININFHSQFDEFRKFKEKSVEDSGSGQANTETAAVSRTETPDEVMQAAHRQIEVSLAQDFLDRIRAAPPAFFERLIVSLLLSMGYGGSAANASRAPGRSGDDDVDGVIDQDALGLDRV